MKLRLLFFTLISFCYASLFAQGLIIHEHTGLKDTVIISTVDSILFTQSLTVYKNIGLKDSVLLSNIDSLTYDLSINPVPTLSSISPSNASAGGGDFILDVTGSNFINSSVVRWNGLDLTTVYFSSTELKATVPAANIISAGSVSVTVFTPVPGGGTSPAVTFNIAVVTTTIEDFEIGTKTSYAAADVTLKTGVWNFNDCLIGNSASDVKNGTKSARMRNGKLTMKFNLTSGAGTVTIQHAMFGIDGPSKWQLWYSIDDGSNWQEVDSTITTNTKVFQTATFTVDINGFIRFELRKSDSSAVNRINFDDITFTSYGSSNTNPTPILTSISPTSDTLAAPGFTLTVNGSNFLQSSVVKWNGNNLVTTFVSATQLQATVPASNLTSIGTANVTVFTSNGGTSAALPFTIIYGQNSPVPVVRYISPATCLFGKSDFNITVTGNYFVNSSVVQWNGASLVTNYVSSTQLRALVTADLVASVGTANVSVSTPPPMGGTSSSLAFNIYNEVTSTSNINLTMGNPSGAVSDTNYPSNFLIQRGQFCTSYNRDRGTPNWVGWELDASWSGPASRQDNFIPDPLVPAQWYHVVTTDYTNTGFNRGHMCPSEDRTRTQADNDSVFFMTNMIPQSGTLNSGQWAQLEGYCRTLSQSGDKLYIYSGTYGEGGTGDYGFMTSFANNKVTVPAKVWKVIMVLPAGTDDLSRVATSTRCIAVIMNNDQGPFSSWGTYRVSVDSVEALTGLDFFSNVPPSVQSVIESVVDSGPTN
jgi:endonuclease G, mitochondrial